MLAEASVSAARCCAIYTTVSITWSAGGAAAYRRLGPAFCLKEKLIGCAQWQGRLTSDTFLIEGWL